jgi:acyl-CoA thioester hydrolase
MYQSKTKLRVRYGETDQMGYVYYGNYAEYFEVGRVESLRNLGCTYKNLESEGIWLPVLDFQIKYLSPARYDDLLTITTKITKLPTARIHFNYEIHNEVGEMLTLAETNLVFISAETGKPTRCPDRLSKTLSAYFED